MGLITEDVWVHTEGQILGSPEKGSGITCGVQFTEHCCHGLGRFSKVWWLILCPHRAWSSPDSWLSSSSCCSLAPCVTEREGLNSAEDEGKEGH